MNKLLIEELLHTKQERLRDSTNYKIDDQKARIVGFVKKGRRGSMQKRRSLSSAPFICLHGKKESFQLLD